MFSSSMPDHWDNIPRALAEGETIRVVSAAAGRMGVRAGMSVPEARVYCATLDVREWDTRAVTDAVMALTGQLLQCSPQVTAASGAPGTWWVGASGFDNVGGEAVLIEQLLRIVRVWHPEARIAIADSCVAARAAAWAPQPLATQRHSCTVVPVGGCREYLAPAPLGLVPMTEELREALQSLGLRTAGALSALAPGDVERRWGAEGIGAWRLAQGDDPRRPGLVRVESARSASAELASATDSMAPLLFLIRSALNRLVQQLLQDGRAAASVAITLSLDARPQHTITREIRPARPLARVAPLFDQCRALLEKWTLEAPVYAVTVSIPATAPLTADQGDLLVPSWRDAAATVDAVFVRLRAALEINGANDVVVHPTPGNAHRPELAGQWQPADALRLAELGSARDLKRERATVDDSMAATTDRAIKEASVAHHSREDSRRIGNNNDTHTDHRIINSNISSSLGSAKDNTDMRSININAQSLTGNSVVAGAEPDRRVGKVSTARSDITTTDGNAAAISNAITSSSNANNKISNRINTTANISTNNNVGTNNCNAAAISNAVTNSSNVNNNISNRINTTANISTSNNVDTNITNSSNGADNINTNRNANTNTNRIENRSKNQSVKNVNVSNSTPTCNPDLQSAALRLLEKPEQVVIQLAEGSPKQVNWRNRRLQFVSTHGPERLSGDWWRADGFARDYWRCTVAGEGDVLVYRDATGWFLQGWYD